MEYLTPTSFEVSSDDGMDNVEKFFMVLGARVRKRKPYSISVWVEHPDGLDVHIKAKHHQNDYMEVMRRCGDGVLLQLVYKMLVIYFDRGDDPILYLGQLCPKLEKIGRIQTPNEVPLLMLDLNLKRNRN